MSQLPRGLVRAVMIATFVAIIGAPVLQRAASAANLTRGCVDRFDASIDYFPDKVAIQDAANFTVEYHRSYKVVTVRETAGGPPEKYVLVQCGTPVPTLDGALAGAQVATVPLSSLFAFSVTQLALLADLNRIDVLTGVSAYDFIDDPAITARIKAGKVVEFAKVELVVDAERVVAARPGLFMTTGESNATLSVIRSAGIPVMADTEWREATALARAEWLKYMALFLNEERKAQELYGAVKDRYRALSARATALPAASRPLVMTGRSTRGTFIIAGGRSYVVSLIQDAGGRYAWADNASTGIVSVDLEAQLRRAGNADVWINGGGWKTLPDMLKDEPRYTGFKAYRGGQVWVYERRMTSRGTNDYWSRSVSHPDIVLADLIKIFHPSLAADHAYEWYMPVPPR